jgi:hypothetical protein
VLKPGGTLAMFSESELGRHALVRNYLSKRGLNVDPHAEFHISLYSKQNLQDLIANAGFEIEKMLGAFLAAFLVHPDEFYPKLSQAKGFFFLKNINRLLTFIKKKTHPVSPAVAEIYGLFEMSLFGKWLEGQSYVILGRSGHPERSETGDEAD